MRTWVEPQGLVEAHGAWRLALPRPSMQGARQQPGGAGAGVRQVAHPNTLIQALHGAVVLQHLHRGEPLTHAHAETSITVASADALTGQTGARPLRGWALAARGHGAEGRAPIQPGLAASRARGVARKGRP